MGEVNGFDPAIHLRFWCGMQREGSHAMRRRLLIGSLASATLAGTGLPRSAYPDDLPEVSVGAIKLPTNAPLFIAMDKGYFTAEGLKVNVTFFAAAATVYPAVVSRSVEIGITATTAATFTLAAKGGFKIIAGYTRERPGFHMNAFMVTNKAYDSGFTSLRNMAGHRIANTTAGSSFQYYVALLAQKYGVDLKSIELVPLESLPNVSAAFQSGQIDAAIIPAGGVNRLMAAGHLLAWCGDEAPWQQGIVFASPQTIASRGDVLKRFLRAYQRGAAEYSANFNHLDADGHIIKGPEYDALLQIIASHSGVKPADLEGQLAYIDPEARPDPDDILKQIAFWQSQGIAPKDFDYRTIFDPSLLPKG